MASEKPRRLSAAQALVHAILLLRGCSFPQGLLNGGHDEAAQKICLPAGFQGKFWGSASQNLQALCMT